MITLLQRVSEARVDVAEATIARIGRGILVLVGIQADDDESRARYFIDRMLNYRVFADSDGKMNLSLIDIEGGLLLVPQLTLPANTKKGRRPSFTRAGYEQVACGQFAADMRVHLVNDGPVTFILD